MQSSPLTPDGVAARYAEWLETQHRADATRFRRRLTDAREDALVEAVAWWILADQLQYAVTRGEGESGGPDFDCRKDGKLLLTVESTAFRSDALSRASTVPPKAGDFAGVLGDVSEALYDRIERKASQSGKREGPVLVVVGTTHWFHDVVFDRWAAQALISGRPMLSGPVGRDAGEASDVTDFKGSVFFRLQERVGIERANEAIAAALLLGINATGCRLIGAINPWGRYPMDPKLLPSVPFCTGTLQPPGLRLEWVGGSSSPARLEFVL